MTKRQLRHGTRIVSRGRAALLAVIALGLVVVLALVVTALASTTGEDDTVAHNRAELRAQAGRIIAGVFSVDFRHWQKDRQRARGLVGPGFVESYGAQLYRPPSDGTAVVWRPESVGLVDVRSASGEILVRVAVTTRAAGAPDATFRQSLLTTFVRSGDHWVLDRADVIG